MARAWRSGRTSRPEYSLCPIRLHPDRPSSHGSGRHAPEDFHAESGDTGVGPDRGLGAQLCKRFAKEGLHVVAAGRTSASLDAVVADIQGSGGEASSFVTDATRDADIAALLSHAGPNVDLAIYNAGSNTPGRILEMEADYFESSWRVVALLRRALVEEVAVGAPGFQCRLHRRRGDGEIEEA